MNRLIAKAVLVSVILGSSPVWADIGIRNYRELLAAFTALTGVQPADTANPDFIQEARGRLPESGRIDNVSGPMMMTINKVAYLYCYKMVQNEAAMPRGADGPRRIHKLVNFQSTRRDLSFSIIRDTFRNYSRQFWRRNASQEEMQAFERAFFDAFGNTTVGGSEEIFRVFATTCTMALTSLEVISI